jgi:hypothetical protein
MLGWLTFLAVIAILIVVLKFSNNFDRFLVLFSKELFDRQEQRKHERQAARDKAYFMTEMQRETGDIKRR